MKMTELSQENPTTPTATAAAKNLPEAEDSTSTNITTTTTTPSYCHTPCSACGSSGSVSSSPPVIQASSTNNNSSTKRRSPDRPSPTSPTSQQDHHQTHRKPKKLFLDNPQELRDFTKITLPSPLGFAPPPNPSTPPLRQCPSDPPLLNGFESLSGSSTNPLSPPEGVNNGAGTSTTAVVAAAANTSPASKSTTAASLPLRRTVSDPSPNSMSSGSSDSFPNYEMFKRMKNRIKEMKLWWDTVIPDRATGAEHEADKGTEDTNATKRMKDWIKELKQWWDTIIPVRATGADHQEDKGTEVTYSTKVLKMMTNWGWDGRWLPRPIIIEPNRRHSKWGVGYSRDCSSESDGDCSPDNERDYYF